MQVCRLLSAPRAPSPFPLSLGFCARHLLSCRGAVMPIPQRDFFPLFQFQIFKSQSKPGTFPGTAVAGDRSENGLRTGTVPGNRRRLVTLVYLAASIMSPHTQRPPVLLTSGGSGGQRGGQATSKALNRTAGPPGDM